MISMERSMHSPLLSPQAAGALPSTADVGGSVPGASSRNPRAMGHPEVHNSIPTQKLNSDEKIRGWRAKL